MDYHEQDNEVIDLLSRLKNTENNYPVDMLTVRRQSFIKQIATFGLGVGGAFVMKGIPKAAGGSSISPIMGTILETALVVVIIAEAGYVAIVNREKILDFFRAISTQTTVEQVSTPPEAAMPPIELPITGPTLLTEMTGPAAITQTPTLVSTPSPVLLPVTGTLGVGDNSDDVHPNSTPEPHDDNGNHYGQTPRPERTKESGGNGNGNGNAQATSDNRNPK